jgi:hypothetical protein
MCLAVAAGSLTAYLDLSIEKDKQWTHAWVCPQSSLEPQEMHSGLWAIEWRHGLNWWVLYDPVADAKRRDPCRDNWIVGLKQIHLKPKCKFLSSIYRNAGCHERYVITAHPGMPENFIATSIEKGNIFWPTITTVHLTRYLHWMICWNIQLHVPTGRRTAIEHFIDYHWNRFIWSLTTGKPALPHALFISAALFLSRISLNPGSNTFIFGCTCCPFLTLGIITFIPRTDLTGYLCYCVTKRLAC